MERRCLAWTTAIVVAVMDCCLGSQQDGPKTALIENATSGRPWLLPLQRVMTRSPTSTKVWSSYYGIADIGGSKLRLSFDTASGLMVLPMDRCSSLACIERRRYRPRASPTAVDINADGSRVQPGQRQASRSARRDSITVGTTNLDLGDGHVAGHLLQEIVCFLVPRAGGKHEKVCTEMGMLAATEMTEVPFRAMPNDGILGLGLSNLSISGVFNFVMESQSQQRWPSKQFAFLLGTVGGELALGGYNPARLASPLAWVPVLRPEEGFWQVRIHAVRVGNRSIDGCTGSAGCRGIIDTCTSSLGAPALMADALIAALSIPEQLASSRLLSDGRNQVPDVGRCPDLHLDLDDGLTLTVHASEYAAGLGGCVPHAAALHLPSEFSGVFLLGGAVLQRYYSVFDVESRRIGFGLAATEHATDGSVTAEAAEVRQQELLHGAELSPSEFPETEEHAPLIEEGRTLCWFLLRALGPQLAVLLLLSTTGGTYIISSRLTAFMRLWTVLLPKFLGVVKHVPPVDGDECVICLSGREEEHHIGLGAATIQPQWCRLSCGHRFHEACVFEWLIKVPRCPVCRCHLFGPHPEGAILHSCPPLSCCRRRRASPVTPNGG